MKVKLTHSSNGLILFIFIVWIFGIVLSKGFWSCFAAIFIPPYSFYIIIEKIWLSVPSLIEMFKLWVA